MKTLSATSRNRVLAAATAAVGLLLPACGSGPPRSEAPVGPMPTAIDSFPLAEPDTLFLGRPRSLSIDPASGDIFVADTYHDRVVRYDRASRMPIRVYGRRGSGPGEFSNIGTILVADSILVGADVQRNVLNLFHKDDARLIGSQLHEGILGDAVAVGDRIILGAQQKQRKTGLIAWNPWTGSMTPLGPLPREYLESEPLAAVYSDVTVAPWRDGWLVGYMGMNDLVRLSADGEVLDTVAVPVVRRRGMPDDAVRRMERLSFPEIYGLGSALMKLHRRVDGSIALIHYDQDLPEPGHTETTVYVSVLAADLSRGCIDGRVDLVSDAVPMVAFRGDTLFVLEQRVTEQGATTFVRLFTLDLAPCEWIALR